MSTLKRRKKITAKEKCKNKRNISKNIHNEYVTSERHQTMWILFTFCCCSYCWCYDWLTAAAVFCFYLAQTAPMIRDFDNSLLFVIIYDATHSFYAKSSLLHDIRWKCIKQTTKQEQTRGTSHIRYKKMLSVVISRRTVKYVNCVRTNDIGGHLDISFCTCLAIHSWELRE